MAAMQFFVMDELTGQQTGPFSLHQIQEQILTRKLKKNDFVRRADSPNWGKASVILAQVFDNVEQHKKDRKQQIKTDKAAKKQQEAQARAAEKRDRQDQQQRPTVAVQNSNEIQPTRLPTNQISNNSQGVTRATRLLYRIANVSGLGLMVIGFSIIGVVFYIFLNAFLIAPAISAADGIMKDNRKTAALAKFPKKCLK